MDLDYQLPSDTPPPDSNGAFALRRNQLFYKLHSAEQDRAINGNNSFVDSGDESGMLSQQQLQDNNTSTSSLPFVYPDTIPTSNSSAPNLHATSSNPAAKRLFPMKPSPRAQFDPNNLSPLSAVDSSDYRSPSSDQFYGSAWDEFAAGGSGVSSSSHNVSSFFNMQHLRRASMQSDVSSYGGYSSAVSPFDSPLLEPRSYQDTPDQLLLPSSAAPDSKQFDDTLATIANQLGLESKQGMPMSKDTVMQPFVADFSQYNFNGGLNQGVSINIVPSSPTWRGQPPKQQQQQQQQQLERAPSLRPSPQPQPFAYRPEEQAPYDLQLPVHNASPSPSSQMPTIVVDNAPDTGNHQGFDGPPNMHRRQRALSESFVVHSNTFPYDSARRESSYITGLDDYTQLLHPATSATPQDSATPPSPLLLDSRSLSRSSDSGQDSYYPSMVDRGSPGTSPWPDHLDVSNSPAMLAKNKHGKGKKIHQRSQSVGYSPSPPTQQEEKGASPWEEASVTAATSAALKSSRSPSASPAFIGSSRQSAVHPSNFVCLYPNCDKRFTRAYNLRSHMRTHTKERPFHCSKCDQSFVRLHDMKRHEALHSGIKAFVCHGILKSGAPWGCGRRFARQDALSRHFLKSASGKQCVKPFLEEMGLSVETIEAGTSVVNGNHNIDRGRGKANTDESNVFDSKFWEQFGKQEESSV